MHKHPRLTELRIENTLRRLRALIYAKTAPLKIEAWAVGGEPVTAEHAFKQNYRMCNVGETWGPAWDTTWFRFSGAIPAAWSGEEVVALVDLGGVAGEGFTCEGLVWKNGLPAGAINVHRSDVSLAKTARGGEEFSFYVEAAANPKAPDHGCSSCPQRDDPTPLFQLRRAEMACVNRGAWKLYHDFKVAFETMTVLPPDTIRRGQLLWALNEACNAFDEKVPGSFGPMHEALDKVLNKRNGDTVHQISAIGHAHIDTAWLWPLRETIRKCARTFSTALAYMEEYPDYVFACSQPQQYAWMKEFYPAIYTGIQAAVRRGQWEPIGSMWVEADTNLSSGESLIRQILHGKNFFMEEFGIETNDVWLPDVFGCNAALPQIMRKAGVKYFVTQKLSWSQFNAFPHHTFLWEGIDGSRIFTHFPPAETYNADFTPKQLLFNACNFKDHDRATRSLYIYGFGDGGGGPTREMLETAQRVKNFEGLPTVTLEPVSSFLAKAEEDARDLPLWIGELYLELHRGTYTTQARNKKANRKCELLLREAEFFDAIAGTEGELRPLELQRSVYDVSDSAHSRAAYLDRAWKLLLLNQFHDILPGSSIGWVYEDSTRDYAKIASLGKAVLDSARANLAEKINTEGYTNPFIIFNTCSFPREEVVSLPDGSPIHVRVPACGYAAVEADAQRPVASFAKPVEVIERKKVIAIDNGMLRIIFDREDGSIRNIRDHRVRREVLASGARGNVFQLHRDQPNNWDAWDVEIFDRESHIDLTDLRAIEVIENTPLRATIRVERQFGNSRIMQKISLCAGSPRIDFDTEVDWQEREKFLKVAFPVKVLSPRATYEIQFGHIERPTHFNTSWDMARFEVCAQKWADLSEGDYGVALLNDCKYGHDIFGHVMRLSLLRAPLAPDEKADRGSHQFTYSLLPHPGDFRSAGVVQQAYALNIPLQVIAAEAHKGALAKSDSFFQVDRAGVIIETIKKAEKEAATIVRFYEAHGTRGPVTLSTTLKFKQAFLCDLLERNLAPIEIEDGEIFLHVDPFEIVTVKLL